MLKPFEANRAVSVRKHSTHKLGFKLLLLLLHMDLFRRKGSKLSFSHLLQDFHSLRMPQVFVWYDTFEYFSWQEKPPVPDITLGYIGIQINIEVKEISWFKIQVPSLI